MTTPADCHVYIPTYNDSEQAIASIKSCLGQGWSITVSDNHSDIQHSDALSLFWCETLTPEQRAQVGMKYHAANMGREGNHVWMVQEFLEKCYFLETSRIEKLPPQWFKYLGAGNTHTPDAAEKFCKAINDSVANDREAPIFVGRLITQFKNGDTRLWEPTKETGWLRGVDVLMEVVQRGNPLHSMDAFMVRRDALMRGYEFGVGVLDCAADLIFAISLAKHSDALYFTDPIVTTHIQNRKTWQRRFGTHGSILQDSLCRQLAAEAWYERTADIHTFRAMENSIVEWMNKCLVERVS